MPALGDPIFYLSTQTDSTLLVNIEYAKFPLLPFLFHFFFFMHLGTSVKGK